MSVPTTSTNEPGAHSVQEMQAWALPRALKVPLAQTEQVRSAVGEPSAPTDWPALQLFQATHGVAGFRS